MKKGLLIISLLLLITNITLLTAQEKKIETRVIRMDKNGELITDSEIELLVEEAISEALKSTDDKREIRSIIKSSPRETGRESSIIRSRNRMNSSFYGKMTGNNDDYRFTFRIRNLDLSEAQLNKIETLETTFKKKMIDEEAKLEKLQIDREMAAKKENVKDEKKFIDDISKVKAEIEKLMVDFKADVRKELTPEQLQKMKRRGI